MEQAKTLFLHIGYPKTGTTALQVWLHQISNQLGNAGYYYPTFNRGAPSDYGLTCGNGTVVVDAFSEKTHESLLDGLVAEAQGRHIVLSTEYFITLKESQIKALVSIFRRYGYSISAIAFVRDCYDLLYSSYIQGIKTEVIEYPFMEALLHMNPIKHEAEATRRWMRHVNQMIVLHYDSERDHLDRAFGQAIGVAESALPPLAKKKVNRSLTTQETELMRMINARLLILPEWKRKSIAFRISGAWISSNPESPTPILLYQDVLTKLQNTCQSDLDWLNQTFFAGENRVRIFNPEGKNMLHDYPSRTANESTSINEMAKRAGLNFRLRAILVAFCGIIDLYGKLVTPIFRMTGIPIGKASRTLGHIDIVSATGIHGWATRSRRQPLTVEIHINDRLHGECVADQYRQDLQKAGIHPQGLCAFSYPLAPGDLAEGDDVSIGFRRKDAFVEIHSATFALQQRPASSNVPRIRGHVDAISPSAIIGWARSEQQSALTLEVRINGRLHGKCVADQYRADLLKAGVHPQGLCAFTYPLAPGDWADGDEVEVGWTYENSFIKLPRS